MKILAVDPGISGAVVRLDWPSGELVARRDFKTLRDVGAAVAYFARECDYHVIEQVGAMPGQGVTSMFSFGRSTGVALGAGYASGIDWIEIAPARWQNYFRQLLRIDPKAEFESRAVAQQMFPQFPELFRRVKDHGTSDAALLAMFAAQELFTDGRLETSRKKGRALVGPQTVEFAPSD